MQIFYFLLQKAIDSCTFTLLLQIFCSSVKHNITLQFLQWNFVIDSYTLLVSLVLLMPNSNPKPFCKRNIARVKFYKKYIYMNYILNMSYVLLNAALVSLQLTRVIDLDLPVHIVRQVSFFFFFNSQKVFNFDIIIECVRIMFRIIL